MFERFTREARAAVTTAEAEARELGSPTVEAEHLLLALAGLDPSTVIGGVLADAGLDRDGVLAALDSERERSLLAVGITIGDFDIPAPRPSDRPRLAASGKRALELALRISLERADKRIAACHIMLALLRAEAGTVRRALDEAGVDRAELNDRVAAALDRAAR
jgi:ATP-dependent Clp protease ATP-binding subunit ClpA